MIFMLLLEYFACVYVEARNGCPSLGTSVRDDCDVDVKKQTQVLCKNSNGE